MPACHSRGPRTRIGRAIIVEMSLVGHIWVRLSKTPHTGIKWPSSPYILMNMLRFLSVSPPGVRPCPRRPGTGWWWSPRPRTSPWPSISARWTMSICSGIKLSSPGWIQAGGGQHHHLYVRQLDRDHPRLRDNVLQFPRIPPAWSDNQSVRLISTALHWVLL